VKHCNSCDRNLDETNFTKDKDKKDGLRTICRDCDRDRQQRRKEETFIPYLAAFNGGCAVCGYNTTKSAIDFHHVESDTKEFTLSMMSTYSAENIKKELVKTIPLCKCCHHEYHDGVGVSKEKLKRLHKFGLERLMWMELTIDERHSLICSDNTA